MKLRTKIALWSALLLTSLYPCLDRPARAAQVEFQNGVGGYAGASDTEIRFSDPDTAFNRIGFVQVDYLVGNPAGPSQGLLRFDGIVGEKAGQIPPGTAIAWAKLTLYSTSQNANSPGTVRLHRMLAGWDEKATWNSMQGGVSNDGWEALVMPDAIFVPDFPNPDGANTQSREVDVTAAVQAWVNGYPNRAAGQTIRGDQVSGSKMGRGHPSSDFVHAFLDAARPLGAHRHALRRTGTVALAHGLAWGSPYKETAFGFQGQTNLSDHFGVIADLNVETNHSSPQTALLNPLLDTERNRGRTRRSSRPARPARP